MKSKSYLNVASFDSLRNTDVFSPLYLVKIIEKRIAEEDIFIEKERKGELYFEGQYLHLTRSRVPRLQFETETRPNDDEVIFHPDELIEPFVQVDESLTMCRNEYKVLLERAQMDY